jgi:uncharacterized membrane protein YesL
MQKTITRPPSVRIAFRTLGRSFRHGYDNLFTLLMVSLLWLLIALPIVPFLLVAQQAPSVLTTVLLFVAIAVVPISPATIALHRVTARMTEERASPWNRFWERFRADWGWGTRLVFTLVLGFVVGWLNLVFYSASTNQVLLLFSGFFLIIVVIWLGIMFYAIPLALRQTDQRVRTTLRNAAIIVLANLPGVLVSLILLLISCVIFLLPPLFLFLPGWIALWSEENVRLLLVASGHIPEDEIADRPRIPRS